jgi:CHASE3 domain sensor protein
LSYSPEELEGIIRSAQRYVRVYKEGKNLRIDVDGQTIRVPYNEELHKKLHEVASEVRASLSTGVKPKSVATAVSDVMHFYTVVRGHRPLVEDLMNRLAWAQRAFLNVGRDTFLAVLLASGEDPKRIPEIVHKFSSEDELHNYVMDKLFNMISASRECADLPSIKEQLWDREVKLSLIEERIDELYDLYMKVRDEIAALKLKYDIALSLMTDEQRDMLTRVLMAIEGYKPQVAESSVEEGGSE